MGAGSSADKAGAASQLPTCPLFYNFSPSPQLIPASTLPTRDSRGNVRRPQGGCAARIVALRHLPVVTPEAKKEAKEFFANVSKMKKAKQGDEPAMAKIAEIEEQARAIQQDPSLAPATSSCFLINIAVDEQGRLAPLSTDGAAALTDTTHTADATGETDAAIEVGSPAPGSQQPSGGRRGFNFEATGASPSGQPAAGGSPSPSNANARRPPQLSVVPSPPDAPGTTTTAAAAAAAPGNMGSLPSPKTGRGPPHLSEAAVVQRLSQQSGGTGATGPASAPAPLTGSRAMPTVFAPPLSTVFDNEDGGDETDSDVPLSSSTRSLLVKDSRYRKGDGTDGTTPTTAAAAVNAGDPTTTRLRRQNSRIRLMQVPNRTRWCFFNDSRTHEAHMTVLFCYDKAPGTEKGAGAHGRDNSAVSPGKMSTEHNLEPGALKLMCVPTPLSHTQTSPKDVNKQLANSSSSSRSFVGVESCSLPDFIGALPTPKTESQKQLTEKFEANASKMAAACFFIVLAPGVTLFLAEGESAGYIVKTHMVPFNPSNSMAVLGRLLTPDMVLDSRRKTAAMVKNCYRHKLIYLSPGDDAPARATATTVPAIVARPATLPEHPAAPPQQRSSATLSSNATVNSSAAYPSTNDNISFLKSAPQPIIQAAQQPYPSQDAATEPMNAAGDAAAAPSGNPQNRLSRRSPSTSPTATGGLVAFNGTAGEQGKGTTGRKRIGSMLRHPSLADGATVEDDVDDDQSFHRDLPSTNSLAISF